MPAPKKPKKPTAKVARKSPKAKTAPKPPKAKAPKVAAARSPRGKPAAAKRPALPRAKAPAKTAPKPVRAKAPVAPAPPPAVVAPKPVARDFPPALVAAVRALDEKKATDIRVLQLGALSSVADYYILATGTSEPHLRALRIELDRALGEAGSRVRGIEAQRESGWVVVDAFDMLFHLFRPEVRTAFRLEALWKDGRDIPVAELLAA